MAIATESARSVMLAARELSCGPPGGPAALTGITLEIRRGTFTALTGENGGGKSSLLLTLAGLWAPLAGTIERGPGRVATVLQEPATQLTQPSVLAEIAFTALNLGDESESALAAARSWAARFGLADQLDRSPQELSAGEQQRVLLAAALAAGPELLLADEAAAHLDEESRRTTLAIVREQAAAGLTVLWVTQESSELAAADRTLVIDRGGVRAERTTSDRWPTSRVAEVAVDSGIDELGSAFVEVRVRSSISLGARIRLVRDLALDIHDRGAWAITGRNGAGKTSLLEAMAGVASIPEVEVAWLGPRAPGPMLVAQYPDRQIFEERVEDEVAYAALRRGLDPAEVARRIDEAFAILSCSPNLLKRRCFALSSGEKRLISIVGALIAPASLLLLDEPTCGLDPDRRSRLAGWIRRIAGGMPVVLASQDRGLIGQVGANNVPLDSASAASSRQAPGESPSNGQKTD